MSLQPGTGQGGGWTAVCPVLLLFLLTLRATTDRASADASTFDAEPLLEKHAQQLSTTELSSTLQLLIDILSEQQEQPQALRQYVGQLQEVLQPDCCDYFTALPTVKGLAAALSGVLYLPLPATLRPVVRRSYVAAIWLLQRSRFFKWDSRALQKAAVSGLDELYEQHMSAASGRPISFHHISKTGGTTLCGVAGDNGCRGPKMSKKDNCLLDPGLDKPVWVLRHNVTVVNNVTAMPPPPPAPPVMADSSASMEAMRQEVAARVAAKFVYDWFMYECPVERLVTAGSVGRPCSELQAGAANKSATFFASENTLPYEQGSTQVCDAFTNVVVVRDAVSEAVSLMTEVALVYTRLLKQHKVLGWSPPKHDLAWWQQWAPTVVNSYAARTLLGPAAFCPAAAEATTPPPLPQPPDSPSAPGGRSGSDSSDSSTPSGSNSSSSDDGYDAFALRERDVQAALKMLATSDVVLDLGSTELMDTSLNKLLGWTAKKLSDGRQQRTNHVLRTPSWEILELLAVQEAPPPPPPPSGVIIRNSPSIKKQSEVSRRFASTWPSVESSQAGIGGVSAAAGQQQGLEEDEQQEEEEDEKGQQENQGSSVPAPAAVLNATEADELRRMLTEVRVREVYSSHGMSHVLLPLQPGTPLLRPSEAVIGAAMTALTAARYAPLKASYVADSSSSNHLLVELELGQPPPSSTSTSSSSIYSKTPVASAPPAGTDSASTTPTYHVWLRHGVLLTVPQYQQLLRNTAGDALLYQHGRVLQALDAGMGAVLNGQRKVRRMLSHVQEEVKGSCGFDGVKFPKAS